MIRIIYMVIFFASAAIAASCSAQKGASETESLTAKANVRVMGSTPVSALPKAVIYKMNGDYASLVPVTLDPSRTGLASYPAPTDITESSAPLAIGNGWYLDRRGGIGPLTAFLKYTYNEYMALPSVPSRAQLMADIVEGAKVTQVRALPITVNAALADTAALKQYTY